MGLYFGRKKPLQAEHLPFVQRKGHPLKTKDRKVRNNLSVCFFFFLFFSIYPGFIFAIIHSQDVRGLTRAWGGHPVCSLRSQPQRGCIFPLICTAPDPKKRPNHPNNSAGITFQPKSFIFCSRQCPIPWDRNTRRPKKPHFVTNSVSEELN